MSLEGADFTGANLSEGILRRVDLTGANLLNANLTKAQLVDAKLKSVNAGSAMMVRANLEGADLTSADMTGTNMSDAYLLQIRYEGAVLSNVTWNGAVLPEELSRQIDQVTEDLLRERLPSSDPHMLHLYWQLMEQLRPFMLRVARLTSLMIHVDAEDLVHDAMVNLSVPPHLERLSKADAQARYDYVYSMMRRMVLSQETKAKGEDAYAADLEPEDEWIDDDEEFVQDEEEGSSTESENISAEDDNLPEFFAYPTSLVNPEELTKPLCTESA